MKNKIRIGLIDDHQIFLEGLERLLQEEADFNVVYTTNKAKNFIDNIKHTLVDVLIVDISMPETNGLELITILKEKKYTGRIIILSSYANSVERDLVDATLLKEISNEKLISTIREVYKASYQQDNQEEKTKNLIHSTLITSREKQIINLIADGMTVNEIAQQVFLSKHTIEAHKKNIFLKLDVNTNAELVKKAMMLGIIEI